MRVIAAFVTVMLSAGVAAAQGPGQELRPYGLDPYKPSDAALLRNYGGALVAQTPLLQLSQLDPYKPSHAALLQQLGGAMPLWSHLSWYPTAPASAPLMLPPANATVAANGPGSTIVIFVPSAPRPGGGVPFRPFPVPPTPPQAPRVAPDTSIQRAALQ